MPLDNFQKLVARTIAPNRTCNSPIAGGSMIQRHGFRLSGDTDIFIRDEDVNKLFVADKALLEMRGLHIEKTRHYDGFIEAFVSSSAEGEEGFTNLQWVREGLNGFFSALEDEEVGFRLHFADLAVNKLMACAGRKEPRDFADLWLIDQMSMPLWRLALAAPGKDARWSPRSIVERIAANMVFTRDEFDHGVDLIAEMDVSDILLDLTDSIDQAREILPQVDISSYGRLAVRDGIVTNDKDRADDVSWIGISPGGNLELTGCNDENLISPIIEKYGIDGSGITDSLTFP